MWMRCYVVNGTVVSKTFSIILSVFCNRGDRCQCEVCGFGRFVHSEIVGKRSERTNKLFKLFI